MAEPTDYRSPLSWQRIRQALTPKTPRSPIGLRRSKNSSIFASVVNLCATAMGAGVLSLGHGFANTGWLLGITCLFLFAVCSDLSLLFIVRSGRACGRHTLAGVAKHYLGSAGMWTANFSLVILLFFALVLVEIVAMDLLPPVIQSIAGVSGDVGARADEMPIYASRLVVGVVAVSAVFPLNLLKSLRSLKYTSTAAILFLGYFVSLLTVRFAQKLNGYGAMGCAGEAVKDTVCGALCGDTFEETMGAAACHFPWNNAPMNTTCTVYSPLIAANTGAPERIFLSLPLMISAFLCQFNILQIDHELDAANKPKIDRIIHIAILGICCTTYIIGGFLGYALEGNCVANDVLKDFSGDDFFTAARFCIGLTNLFKIPLLLVPLRTVTNETLCALTAGRWPEKPAQASLFIETVVIYLVCFVTAYELGSISKDLDLLGSTVGIVVVFVIPALLYIKMLDAEGADERTKQRALAAGRRGGADEGGGGGGVMEDDELELHNPLIAGDGEAAADGGGAKRVWTRAYAAPVALLVLGVISGAVCFSITLIYWAEA